MIRADNTTPIAGPRAKPKRQEWADDGTGRAPMTIQDHNGPTAEIPAPRRTAAGTTELQKPQPRIGPPVQAAVSAGAGGGDPTRPAGIQAAPPGMMTTSFAPPPSQVTNPLTLPAPAAAPAAPAAPTPGAAPAAPAAPTGTPLVQTSPIDPNAPIGAVQPARSQELNAILQRVQDGVMQQIDNPTVWDDELAQQVKASARTGIDRNFADEERHLDARLAGRGIAYSSIAGDEMRDLGAQRANALSQLDADIAQQRANSIAQGRRSALDTALGVAGFRTQLEGSERNEARGERAYGDGLRREARGDALQTTLLEHQLGRESQNDWMQAVLAGLNYGNNGVGVLGQAGNTLGGFGQWYGGQEAAANEGLGDLAGLFMQYFMGGQGG